MVSIRLKKLGRKAQPYYRIVAAPSRNKRDGAVLEELGFYHPIIKNEDMQIKLVKERIEYWINQGAQPTPIVKRILNKNGIQMKRSVK